MANQTNKKKFAPRGLSILHEDRDIIIINKKPGVLSCHTVRREMFTAEEILTEYLRKGAPASRKQAWLVHRLDRETSGIMLFAKSEEVQLKIKSDWANTEKFYLAAVYGHFNEQHGTIKSYLAEDTDFHVFSTKDPNKGRFSQTDYSVIGETDTLSFVKIRLLTGRKNQIRVHFSEQGHPIVGDPKYNRGDTFKQRLCLHAKSITFNHPFTGKRCTYSTDIPLVFRELAPGFREADWNEA